MVNMKSRRHQPCAEEVIKKWWKLSAEQREQVMTFTDRELLASIRHALSELQLNHETMIAAGLTEESDPFKSSLLLAQAFSFNFDGTRSTEDPTLALVAASTSVMTMNDHFLERRDFFDQLKLVLPDFLSPKSGSKRIRLPRSSWKQLWEVPPSSFIALDQNLVKTAEQALWAMASDLQCTTPAADLIPYPLGGALNEDWIDEGVPDAKVSKACGKSGKKKRKQKARAKSHSSISTACPSSGAEDLTEPLEDVSQAEACSASPSAGLVVPASSKPDMSSGKHEWLQEVGVEVTATLDDAFCLDAVMHNPCSGDPNVLDKPVLGDFMLQNISPSDHGFSDAASQGVDIKEWSEQTESCGPQDVLQTMLRPWQSIAGIAHMKVEDSDMADLSSHTSGTTDIEEFVASIVEKIYDDQDEGETVAFAETRAQYFTAPLPLNSWSVENDPSQEAAEAKQGMKLDYMPCLESNWSPSHADIATASQDDVHESSMLRGFATGHQFLPIGPPPGLDMPDGPQDQASQSPEPCDAAFTAKKSMQGYCDHRLALVNFLAQGLQSSPEQLMQFARNAPPEWTSVYRDLLSLQASLASAFH